MTIITPCLRVSAIILFTFCAVTASFAEVEAPSLRLLNEQYTKLHSQFAKEMNELADFCEANSFFTDADRIRKRAASSDQGVIDYDQLPTHLLPDLPKQMAPIEAQWRTKLLKLEKDYALQLYRLSLRAINKNHASFAYRLIRKLVFHSPDHQQGRKLLGYVRYNTEWTTFFSRLMRIRNFVDHPEFGWILANKKARYESGERFFDGRWMSVEREESQRSDFRNGWEIETEHFLIKTNHSLEKGVEIGRQLEEYHRFFMREYAAFFSTPQQMQRLFNGAATSRRNLQNRHRVYYFANREEFVNALKSKNQANSIATGFYLPRERTSFFYHDDDPVKAESNRETMFHEVTHQLLGESSNKRFDVAEAHNFWIIEGFACYMESIEIPKPAYKPVVKAAPPKIKINIGDPTHPRIYWARQKVVVEEYYIPMQRFTYMGKKEFQAAPNNDILHAYYSQAAGIVHFFMHYKSGLYRDALIEHLSQIYSPSERIRVRPSSLEKLTGVPFPTLDQQYREYMKDLKTN